MDREGNKIGVFIDIKTYEQIIDDLEELEDIRAFDAAKAVNDEAIPFSQAVQEIEKKRGK